MRFTRLFLMVIALLYLATTVQGSTVRLIYFLPSDRTAQSDIDTKIDTVIKGAQTAYSNRVGKTFTFETNSDGTAKVHHITGDFTDAYYESADKWRVWDEIKGEGFDPTQKIYVAFVDLSSGKIDGWCGTGGDIDAGGVVTMAASADCLDGNKGINIAVHELGHAFGLRHDYRSGTAVDPGAGNDPMVTSTCAIEWLKGHPYFNGNSAAFSTSTSVEMSTPTISGSDVTITFTIADSNGLHQAQFFHHILSIDGGGYEDLSLLGCQSLDGNSATATFTTSTLTSSDDTVTLRGLNDAGSQFEVVFSFDLSSLSANPTDGDTSADMHKASTLSIQDLGELTLNLREPREDRADVNADGIVNIQDLVLIASNFGQYGQNRADINEDGVVNITDLVLVAQALGKDAAAPSIRYQDLEFALTRANVQHWLRDARQANLTDPTFQRGILMLKQLLASLTPKETALLPNYPNPFNPETWIPYRLAKPTDVSISIYTVGGKLVRTLELGHQSIGIYQNKSRAAYWDGKNELGEPVASGVYFYSLSAGDFSATRKMLIRK